MIINLMKIFLLIVLLKTSETECKQLDKISIKGRWFVDESDRVVLFRGINAVRKLFPWLPNEKYIDMTNKTQLNYLSNEWGFNVVRLGLMWSGLMPEKNVINQTYLNEILSIIDNLALFQIYVIIDLHQDMMSSKFNSYDGMPLWALNELPLPKREYPWPFQNGSNLIFQAYLTEACGFAFECLYKNVNSFQDYFLQYWQIVAENLANRTSVLAYEIINEPWAGDIYSNPFYLLPGVAGSKNLLPLYDKVYDIIRKYDSKTIIFYEPVTWSVMSSQKYVNIGFERPPRNDLNTTALAWHYYCWLLQTNPHSMPLFEKVFCDDWQIAASFNSVEYDLKRLGGSANFLTEFGVCSIKEKKNDENLESLNTDECELILDYCDSYFTSWTYWDSNFYHETNFGINHRLVRVFSRVYPVATNGLPLSINFNITNGRFEYKFTMKDLRSSTDIFVPQHVYPNGFSVILNPELDWSFSSEEKILKIFLRTEFSQEFFNTCHVILLKK